MTVDEAKKVVPGNQVSDWKTGRSGTVTLIEWWPESPDSPIISVRYNDNNYEIEYSGSDIAHLERM